MLLCLFFIDGKSMILKSVAGLVPKHSIVVDNGDVSSCCINFCACLNSISINMAIDEQLRALKCLLQRSKC